MNSNPLPTNVKFTDSTQLPAMLWLVEGNIPRLYADPKGIPTIGIGVNVQVPQNMAAVLSQISVNNVNIFEKGAHPVLPGAGGPAALGGADLCVTYGAEGTMLKLLLAGVPQVISPWHVETFMAARRVEALQAGRVLKVPEAAEGLGSYLAQLYVDLGLKAQATAFAHRHAEYTGEQAVAAITHAIKIPQEQTDCRNSSPTVDAPNGREKVGVQSESFS